MILMEVHRWGNKGNYQTLLPTTMRNRPAKSLVEDKVGKPHYILAAYLEEIESWTPLKPGDSIVYRKFYNYLSVVALCHVNSETLLAHQMNSADRTRVGKIYRGYAS